VWILVIIFLQCYILVVAVHYLPNLCQCLGHTDCVLISCLHHGYMVAWGHTIGELFRLVLSTASGPNFLILMVNTQDFWSLVIKTEYGTGNSKYITITLFGCGISLDNRLGLYDSLVQIILIAITVTLFDLISKEW
jgi:hypothetical protein